jgi:hypothetical protein
MTSLINEQNSRGVAITCNSFKMMNSLIQTPPLLSNYTETRKIKTQKNFTTTK